MTSDILTHIKKHEAAYQLAGVSIAIIIAIVSLGYSCQANWNSMQMSRPYLSLDVVPQDGQYLRASVHGDSYILAYTLKVKNTGQTPALNISFSDDVDTERSDGTLETTRLEKSVAVIAIPAGDESTIDGGFRFPVQGNPSNLVSRVASGDFHMVVQVVVQYEGPFSHRKRYFTGLAADVYGGHRALLGSSMK